MRKRTLQRNCEREREGKNVEWNAPKGDEYLERFVKGKQFPVGGMGSFLEMVAQGFPSSFKATATVDLFAFGTRHVLRGSRRRNISFVGMRYMFETEETGSLNFCVARSQLGGK